jgi:hypothetical protein
VDSTPASPDVRRGESVVVIDRVEDRRPDTDRLGMVGGRQFSSGDVCLWIDQELRSMASPSFVALEASTPDAAPALRLRPRLLKAYVHSVQDAKAAVIVLEVQFIKSDGASWARVFRGQQASMNWFSSKGEVTAALQDAMSVIVSDLKADIEARLR